MVISETAIIDSNQLLPERDVPDIYQRIKAMSREELLQAIDDLKTKSRNPNELIDPVRGVRMEEWANAIYEASKSLSRQRIP